MKKLITLILIGTVIFSCKKDDYIIGGENNGTNKVDMTTMEFLASLDVTNETARLFDKAGLASTVNGDVTVLAPSIYAINRYLRRQNNRRLRLDPKSNLMTADDISAEELQKMKMYLVAGKYWRETIPQGGIVVPTLAGTEVKITLEKTNAEPGAAWDGGSTPGQGYQYSNFMQEVPEKVTVQFKRGLRWESDPTERLTLGLDNEECDQVYQMYLSDVLTKNGVVHVIYSGNYNYSDHYYYHSLFFFGTRADDLL
ncbi:fasciclin domain-containing protein [Arcticibacter tournemirensis]|uniref:FAS1 domain-containing protein n=2 Tax=Pseudomonadati TaxID=3379134 RepID=A0A4Q0MAU9_9SPHI|nr:hypothetical protein [Arcticibacter tournemirensis]RXF70133.1 hypothetical protein EKH83_09635 [Arcticibacter tournemirensis]